jgi:hypothetical protein
MIVFILEMSCYSPRHRVGQVWQWSVWVGGRQVGVTSHNCWPPPDLPGQTPTALAEPPFATPVL